MTKGTVTVNLGKDWFSPDNSLYQKRDNPHEFPAAWADPPEKKEDESDDDWKARKKRQPFAVLPSDTEVIAEGDGRTVAVFHDTADGSQVLVAETVEKEVKSVGGALDEKGLEQPTQTVAAAEKGADALNVEVGGKPRQSGPLPAGHQKTKG